MVRNYFLVILLFRRGAGVVELARLESVCARKGTVGSNPTLSANNHTTGPKSTAYSDSWYINNSVVWF